MRWKVKARAREWDLGMSANGKEQIAVFFEYVDHDGEARSITWYGYFTDATWERTIESMRFMGWTGDNLGDLEGLDSKEVELVLEDEEYDGKVRTKVQWVNRAGLALKAPMSQVERKSFAERMRGRIRGLDAASGRVYQGYDQSPHPADDDDDINF